MHIRIADLFCGIGGIAEAVHLWSLPAGNNDGMTVGDLSKCEPRVVTAIDIDRSIATLYQHQHGIAPRCSTIESLHRVADSSSEKHDMWWMSPPCQPYTIRGSQKGADDFRSHAMARVLQLLSFEKPRFIGLENVPAFEGSQHHQQLKQALNDAAYQIQEHTLCPTDMGIPMRRKRFYLIAKQGGKPFSKIPRNHQRRRLNEFINTACWADKTLVVPPEAVRRYKKAMNIIDVRDLDAITSCFTSAYGKSPIRSGSYLHCPTRNTIRRFSPNEIATLMGFRHDFFSPVKLSQRNQYRLIGNSLAVPVVNALLSVLLSK